jgi:hypothetical protein
MIEWIGKWTRQTVRRAPIIGALVNARWAQWREALKEVLIILLFSLMPVWLGLLLVTVLTVTNGPHDFLEKFASSSDLGILAASLLGPLLYMMFRDEGQSTNEGLFPRFPDGLWFTVLILVACVVATVIYCFTYLSGIGAFFNKGGMPINFIDKQSVSTISWLLFVASILLVLFASTIRNSLYSRTAQMMNEDTQRYVAELETAEQADAPPLVEGEDSESFTAKLKAAQEGQNGPTV